MMATMPKEGAELLRRWYAPYNAALAAMIGDDAFLWADHAGTYE